MGVGVAQSDYHRKEVGCRAKKVPGRVRGDHPGARLYPVGYFKRSSLMV